MNSPLKPKYELAAMLIATGRMQDQEVAEKVGVTPNRLSVMKGRPEFQQMLTLYRERFVGACEEEIRAQLQADFPANFDFLKRTRDGRIDDDKDTMNLRLKAADMLWDKQVPRREAGSEAAGVTVVINADIAKRISTTEVEEGEWDDEPAA